MSDDQIIKISEHPKHMFYEKSQSRSLCKAPPPASTVAGLRDGGAGVAEEAQCWSPVRFGPLWRPRVPGGTDTLCSITRRQR